MKKINNYVLAKMIINDIKLFGDISFRATLQLCNRDEESLDKLKDAIIDREIQITEYVNSRRDVCEYDVNRGEEKLRAIKLALIRVEEVRWAFHNFSK